MSLENWRNNGWLAPHSSGRQEIGELLAIADRDLKDCRSEGLSKDWKFNIAYNSILQSAAAALAAAGYRASHGGSHHYTLCNLWSGRSPCRLINSATWMPFVKNAT